MSKPIALVILFTALLLVGGVWVELLKARGRAQKKARSTPEPQVTTKPDAAVETVRREAVAEDPSSEAEGRFREAKTRLDREDEERRAKVLADFEKRKAATPVASEPAKSSPNTFTRAQLGGEWPFVAGVTSVTVGCQRRSYGGIERPVVWFKTQDGRRYGMNSPGMQTHGKPDSVRRRHSEWGTWEGVNAFADMLQSGLDICGWNR